VKKKKESRKKGAGEFFEEAEKGTYHIYYFSRIRSFSTGHYLRIRERENIRGGRRETYARVPRAVGGREEKGLLRNSEKKSGTLYHWRSEDKIT